MKITLFPTAVAASVLRSDDNANDNDIVDHTLRTFESHFGKKSEETHFENFDDVDRAVCPADDHNSGLCGPWGISALQTASPDSHWFTNSQGPSKLTGVPPTDASTKNCVKMNNCCKTTANALATDGDQMMGVTCSACQANHMMVSAFTQSTTTTSGNTPVAVCMARFEDCNQLANCHRASTDQALGDTNNLVCGDLQCRECQRGHEVSETGVCVKNQGDSAVETAVKEGDEVAIDHAFQATEIRTQN